MSNARPRSSYSLRHIPSSNPFGCAPIYRDPPVRVPLDFPAMSTSCCSEDLQIYAFRFLFLFVFDALRRICSALFLSVYVASLPRDSEISLNAWMPSSPNEEVSYFQDIRGTAVAKSSRML